VFAAGWRRRELHDAILTVCLFDFMSRLRDGHGAKGSAEVYGARGQALQESGHAPLLALLPGGEPLSRRCRCGHRATMGGTPNTPRQPTPY
jgi:hypothetical protein